MSKRTDSASRFVPASPQAIYDAFVAPERLMQWLPPGNMTGRVLEFEPHQGGRYRIELTYKDETRGKTADRTDVSEGRFLELDPGRKIVWSVDFQSDDPAFAGTMIMTWLLEQSEGGTRVTIAAEAVPSGLSKADHDEGLNATLANLADYFGE